MDSAPDSHGISAPLGVTAEEAPHTLVRTSRDRADARTCAGCGTAHRPSARPHLDRQGQPALTECAAALDPARYAGSPKRHRGPVLLRIESFCEATGSSPSVAHLRAAHPVRF